MKNILKDMGKNILLSYPRSGNTWLRYCIEFLSKKPTVGYTSANASNFDRNPMGSFNKDMGVDLTSDYILYKRHTSEGWDENTKIILILRDYKEVIIRHNTGRVNIEKLKRACLNDITSQNYTQLIEYYDDFKGEKLLLYYEDIITNLKDTLEQICGFLDIETTYLDEFIENIVEHKKRSINIYGNSKTKGNSIKSHSNSLSDNEKTEWDNYIKDKLGDLSDQYMGRYYEVQD